MTVRVKICGLAREEDYLGAVGAGPDAVGFVFWPKSPRAVKAAQVADWTRGRHPRSIRKVGVFVNQTLDEVIRTVETVNLDVVQLHGGESLDYMESVPVPVWKSVHLDRMPEDWRAFPVEALLVDSGTREMPGGTGLRVEEERAAEFVAGSPLRVWLAGGLNAGNVGSAVQKVGPYGVDVSSGVERAPGVKDLDAVREFVRAARTVIGD